MQKIILMAALLIQSICVCYAAPLTPYRADYEATWKAGWFPITVQAIRTLIQLTPEPDSDNQAQWQLTFEVYSSVADLSEISQFSIQKNTIKPINYRYKTSGFLTKKRRVQEFDWQENKVWLPNKNIWGEYSLPKNLQDNLSYQEQIRLDLRQGKNEFSYPVAYKHRLKEYQFKVTGESQLKTQQGFITAIEVAQVQPKNPKESTLLWFAKDHDFLLLKLETKKKNGNKHTVILKNVQMGEVSIIGF